jgi:hypothetical protein
MMKFTASTSTTVKVVTAAIFILAIGLALVAIKDEVGAAALIPASILAIVIAVSYYFSIRHYEIGDGKLIVRRPFDAVQIPLGNISDVQTVDRKRLRWAVRTFGIDGLFSYTGTFWNKELGSMTWYLTRMDKAVLIVDSNGKKIVVSPDDPQKFGDAVKN